MAKKFDPCPKYGWIDCMLFKPLHDIPISGLSNSAAHKDM